MTKHRLSPALPYLLIALVIPGCAEPKNNGFARAPIAPVLITDRVAGDPDDPAIWINPRDPNASLILGTDKGTSSHDGALYVFGLGGSIIKEKTVRGLGRPNNVDVEYGLKLGDSRVDIAVVTERYANRLRVYRLPEMKPIDRGGIPVFDGEDHRTPMGIALYKRPKDGTVYAIVSRKRGPLQGYLWQYRLKDMGDGTVTGVKVRQFGQWSGRGEVEALAVDDALGFVYASDEAVGIRKYRADPDAADANKELALFGTKGFAKDREGISIYEVTDTTGYILVSDQGGNRFHVFPREGAAANPHDHPRLHTISVRAVRSDGSDAASRLMTKKFPGGLFVAMSDDKTFHLYSWERISSGTLKVAECWKHR